MRRHDQGAQRSPAMPSLPAPSDTTITLLGLGQRLTMIEQVVADLQRSLNNQTPAKDWYSTSELAQALGISQFTVQVRWCHAGRIAAKKDAVSGRWRIPGHEFQRLVRGGSLRPPHK